MILTSRQNPVVLDIRKKRDHPKGGWIFIEGPRLFEEAIKSGLEIEHLIVVPDVLESPLVVHAIPKAKTVTQVTPYVFETLSDVEAPQGILALCRKPEWTWEAMLVHRPAPVIILDGVQDPGNAASIARTAEAAGAGGIITTIGTVRLYSPKALRAAAGSTLRLPVFEHLSPAVIVDKLKAADYQLLGTSGIRGTLYTELDWSKPWALVLGQEGGGVSPAWEGLIAQSVTIPMNSPVESLNVAAAAAILLYHAKSRN